jgi:hypothetical protein
MQVKKLISKAEVRTEINQQIDDFLDRGGEVTNVATGTSGRDEHLSVARSLFDKPRESRTYVPEVIAAIDSRKPGRPKTGSDRTTTTKPRKKIIYDDFGEAVREVWVTDNGGQ